MKSYAGPFTPQVIERLRPDRARLCGRDAKQKAGPGELIGRSGRLGGPQRDHHTRRARSAARPWRGSLSQHVRRRQNEGGCHRQRAGDGRGCRRGRGRAGV